MVFGISNFDLIAGGFALVALVVAFVVLGASMLRHRGGAQSPRLHIGLGAPLERPIPERRPSEPPVLDESPETSGNPGQPPEVANEADELGRDSGDSVVVADIQSENQSLQDIAGRVYSDDDADDDVQVVIDMPPQRRVAGEVMGDSKANELFSTAPADNREFAAAPSDATESELAELRLALDASQTELTHLTASRDHAMSVVAESEQCIAQLRQDSSERDSRHAQQQQELATQVADITQHSVALEAELAQTRAQLEATAEQLATRGSTSEENLAQTESQRTAIFELRQLLGQYEAIQASLQREKLDFATQVRDWQQKADRLEAELELVRRESAEADPSALPRSDSADASQQLEELQDAHQQAVADLSLANETVKQLNQQLMLRDAAFAQVEYEKQQLDRQLAEHNERTEESQNASVANVEVAQQRDQARAELNAAKAELEGAQHELALLQTVEADHGEGSQEHVPPVGDEEGQAQRQRLQSILEDRDRGYGELQKRLTELEETHRLTEVEANGLRSKLSLAGKLSEENAEYRESIARLQADANALAELELKCNRDRAEFEEQLQQIQIANEAAIEQLKQLTQRDAGIQDMAAKLGKVRDEVASLTSELQKQQALVRALRAGRDTESEPIENGQAAPRSVRKRESRPRDATRIRPAAQFREVCEQPPEQVDDLKQINGIGPVLEKRLNDIGIYRFEQIKEWTKSAVEQLDAQLSLRGRIVRDRWVQQARKFSKS